jgi:hypothetical protein
MKTKARFIVTSHGVVFDRFDGRPGTWWTLVEILFPWLL